MNTRILIAVVVSMFLCQQVYAQDEPEAEATELEGTWEVVSCVIHGVTQDVENEFWLFEGNRTFILNSETGDIGLREKFTVDPTAMPAQIDFENWPFEDVIPIDRSTRLGIYELDGDKVTICYGIFWHFTRPDIFESIEGSLVALWVLRRVEDSDE